jgi:hypothetical protein
MLPIYGNSNSHSFPGGIYINKATIISVEDISGEQLTYMKQPCDLGLRVTVDIGRAFMPTMTFAGNFKIGDKGIEWGNAFRVRNFIRNVLPHGASLTEENKIPTEVLENLIGKEFYRLSYISGKKEDGKLKYAEWSEVGRPTGTPEELHVAFRRSLEKGYPKNYSPDALSQNELPDTSFPAVT